MPNGKVGCIQLHKSESSSAIRQILKLTIVTSADDDSACKLDWQQILVTQIDQRLPELIGTEFLLLIFTRLVKKARSVRPLNQLVK